MRVPPKRKQFGSSGSGGFNKCHLLIGAVTLLLGLVMFYSYLFTGLKKIKDSAEPGSTVGKVINEMEHAARSIKSYLQKNPSAADCNDAENDPDAWLDSVHDEYPPIVPSHYGQVHGVEPFELPDTKPFTLHTIPTDDWYEKAKKATDRCDLELTYQTQGAENGLDDKVVWVSGLLDLKRGESGNADFQRSMSEYYRRFQIVLDRGFQMVIYIPEEFEQHLKIDRSRIKVIYFDVTKLRTYFPYFDRVQQIRTSKLWTTQAVMTGWLSNAPQARLPEYNPLVMSKLMMVRDAARMNPWGARYHMWMDAGHLCAGDLRPSDEGTNLYRRHMAEGFFVTHWPYGTTTEVHGMTDKAMHLYLASAEDPLRIVRGGIFGGTLPYVECVLKAYILALHQTLMDGYLGTEECIWAMVHARFPHLFKSFDNNSLGNHGDNCASFQASAMEEKEVQSGKQPLHKGPAIPKYPSWWDEAQSKKGNTNSGKASDAEKNEAALLKVGGVQLRGKQ